MSFDPYAAGEKAIEVLKNERGGALNEQGVMIITGDDSFSLKRARENFRIVYWVDDNKYYYPVWQFAYGAPMTDIRTVLQIFKSYDYWRVMRYFLAPRIELGDSPLNLLEAGEVNKVLDHAKRHFREETW